jgi:DNA repair protein RecN (Recombination protein N)
MLKRLTIKNYILIDSLTIDFGEGLSVITGETGAGKSILVGALGLLAGAKPDIKNISQGATKSVIEGVFDISKLSLKSIFEENDIDFEEETIIRREINENGKTRAFVNDTPVSVSFLKELSKNIIEIHSQHQNLLLADNSFQLDAVDIYAGNGELLEQYKTHYNEYQQANKELKRLVALHQQAKQEEEYVKFVVNQLQDASIKEDEDRELEEEQNQLSHAEEIKEGLYKSATLFDDEDGIVSKLSIIVSEIKSINKKVKTADLSERIECLYIEAKDIASEVSSMAESVTYDPQRLEKVEERLSQIYTLLKRYNQPDIASLLQYKQELEEKLSTIDGGESAINDLQKRIGTLKEQMVESAKRLSKARKSGGENFSKALEDMARPLSLPNINFKVEWEQTDDYTEDGAERALFTFSANKNVPLTSLSKSASGGEISRLMLCVKAMIATNRTMPVMLFDEVDSGISGETAGKVGGIMEEMSKERQIIVITHLPQVAVKGTSHYNISKQDIDEKTIATVKQLTDEERVSEVARMMSDGVLSPEAISLATQLLTPKK